MVVAIEEGRARAWFIGNRIDVRELERGEIVALSPLTIRAGSSGYAVLFRYGVAVLFNLNSVEEAGFIKSLSALVNAPYDDPETEALTFGLASDDEERIDSDGVLRLVEINMDRLHVIAHILAKSAVLAYHEERVAIAFDQSERLAQRLQNGSGQGASRNDLMKQIGNALITQVQTVGRVEVTEKPESTWDDPELDRLYERLSAEYELRDRDLALTRKLDFISQIAETYLDLLQTRQSLRLEWYIVFLIVVEIVLSLYQLFR